MKKVILGLFIVVTSVSYSAQDYEFCREVYTNNGVVYVEFFRVDTRPNDEWPEGAFIRGRKIPRLGVDDRYHKCVDGSLDVMTLEEQEARDAYDIAQEVISEALRQAAKPTKLKEAENAYFDMCAALGLSGKPTFTQLRAAINALRDPQTADAVLYAIQLLSIDAEAKREGGLNWWDDATYHEEITE